MLLLAPRLVSDFAAEAPDVWSVAAVMVVGTWTREALLETMLDYVPALVRLADLGSAATVGPQWRPALSRHPGAEQAKQLLELLLVEDADVAARLNVPRELPWNIAEFFTYVKRRGIRPEVPGDPDYWSRPQPYIELTFVGGPSPTLFRPILIHEDKLADKDLLLTSSLWTPLGDHTYAWIVGGSLDILDPRLAAARRCFALICVPHRSDRSRRWSVLRGTQLDAPVIGFPSDLALPVVTLQRRGMGSVSVRLEPPLSDQLRPSAQLWLPHLDAGDLGTAQLYVPQ